MIRDMDPVASLLVGVLVVTAILVAVVMLFPSVHHVGDTRYCTGTGVGVNTTTGQPVVVTVNVPCGTYRSGDPDVTR